MNDVKTINKQNLADITLQVKGEFEQIFEVALENKLSITDSLNPGLRIINPIGGENIDILSFYKIKNVIPATNNIDATYARQQLFEDGLFQPGLFE
ncbi:MAG: hypothetical protein CL528_11285 [Aequorivita sp.]|nr:hypothetical protein [Aequorivita sp.]MBP42349.1 hypothetical protein [Aequorivita sp.]|tara:strand:- start:1864 stop:2151 length:288 start_codon:yes stop_codon:yes gene_type:complete